MSRCPSSRNLIKSKTMYPAIQKKNATDPFILRKLILIFTKIIFSQDDSIFFLVFVEALWVIIRRSPGPDFDKIFEVPGII